MQATDPFDAPMKEHGILTLGRDLKEAYLLSDLLEDAARVAFIASSIRD